MFLKSMKRWQAVTVAAGVLALGVTLAAQKVQITGAGATFPNPIYSKWFSEYNKLHPNVDCYSGFVQRAFGIPVSLFTAIFSLARTVGWIAQLNEMIADPEYKIGRPRQLFVGSTKRDVKPLEAR